LWPWKKKKKKKKKNKRKSFNFPHHLCGPSFSGGRASWKGKKKKKGARAILERTWGMSLIAQRKKSFDFLDFFFLFFFSSRLTSPLLIPDLRVMK